MASPEAQRICFGLFQFNNRTKRGFRPPCFYEMFRIVQFNTRPKHGECLLDLNSSFELFQLNTMTKRIVVFLNY